MNKTVQIQVSGIKCEGCEKKIKTSFDEMGIDEILINRDQQILEVTLKNDAISTMKLVAKLNELGFPVENFKTV